MHPQEFVPPPEAGLTALPETDLPVGKVEIFWEEATADMRQHLRQALAAVVPGLAGLEPLRFQFGFFDEFRGGGVDSVAVADTRQVLLVFHGYKGAPWDFGQARDKGCAVILFDFDTGHPRPALGAVTLELHYGGGRYVGTYEPGGPVVPMTGIRVKPVDTFGAGGMGYP
jgi:hypothetical protein